MSPASEPSRRLAATIKATLVQQDRSAAWLARRTGLDEAALGRRLRGETPIDVDELAAIAAALGVTSVELLDS